MPFTISSHGGHVTVYADDHGLDQLVELINICKRENFSKIVDKEEGTSVSFVRDPEWTPR